MTLAQILAPGTGDIGLVGDKLVVSDYEGYLHWFSRETGKLLGRRRATTERNYVRPQLWNNTVITLDRLGFLSAISAQP